MAQEAGFPPPTQELRGVSGPPPWLGAVLVTAGAGESASGCETVNTFVHFKDIFENLEMRK